MGFRPIGSIAAQLVTVTCRRDLPIGDCTATVLLAEGAAQLIWHRGEPGPLVGTGILWNDFLAPGMGAQLRHLADAVDAAQALIEPNGGFK